MKVFAGLILAASIFLVVSSEKLTLLSPLPELLTSKSAYSILKPNLTVVALINGRNLSPMGPVCTEGMQIALDAASKHVSTLFERYNIVMRLIDDGCIYSEGVRLSLSIFRSGETDENNLLPFLIGPLCFGNRWTGRIHHRFNFVGISDSSIVNDVFSYRDRYNSFFSVAPSLETYYQAVPHLLKSNGWTSNVYLFSETTKFWPPLEDVLFDNLDLVNITIAGTVKLVYIEDTLPTDEQWEAAVKELAALKPKVIIMNSVYGAFMMCWLAKFGIYGPGVVLIWIWFAMALPNSPYRYMYPWCTDDMIFEVSQSIIYHWEASPINMKQDVVDVFGVSRKHFENTLRERIDRPDITVPTWYWARHLCYNQLVASLITLNNVEKELQEKNDTLSNWVTNSKKFQNNGTKVHDVMKKYLEVLNFPQFTKSQHVPMNSKRGITGFFQVQTMPCAEPKICNSDADQKSARLIPVPVASYDALTPTYQVTLHEPYVWRTHDGLVPADSVRFVVLIKPIISDAAHIATRTLAAILLLAIAICYAFGYFRNSSGNVANPMPFFKVVLLVGNSILLTAIFVFPVEATGLISANCMASATIIMLGFSLIICSVLTKLHIGFLVSDKAPSKHLKTADRMRPASKSHNSQKRLTMLAPALTSNSIDGHSRATNSATLSVSIASIGGNDRIPLHYKQTSMLFKAFLGGISGLIIVWFSMAPIQAERFDLGLEVNEHDNIGYERYTYACNIRTEFTVTKVVMGIIAGFYGVILLRSIYLAVVLRKQTVEEVEDVHLFRIAAYCIGLLTFAGSLVIWLFFSSSDPGQLQIAVSGLILTLSLACLVILYIPRLKRNNQN